METITNLSQYYTSIGQRLPSVSERASGDAARAGIQGYTGTVAQNQQLLSFLMNQKTTPTTGRPNPFVSTQTPTNQNNAINMGQIDFGVTPTTLFPATPTVTPTTTNTLQAFQPSTDISPDSLLQERSRIQQDIFDIETRLNSLSTTRDKEYEEAGIFEDIRALNDLRAEQRRLEDRNVEIPIEARQQLRGKGATITEFDQTTAPRLEENLLRTLANTRQVSSLTDVINTNQAIIDARINEQKELDTLMYTQRLSRLNQVESLYYDVMTNEQKNALELAKMSAEFGSVQSQFYGDIISGQYKALQERGIYIDPNSTPEQISQQYQNLLLDDRDLRVETNGVIINQIEDLLKDVSSLQASVGTNMFSRGVYSGIFGAGATVSGRAKAWRENLANLLANTTFQKLAEITKESSLGSISEGELGLVRNAASVIKQMANGKVDLPEREFVKYMNTINNSMMKINLRELMGAAEYTASGIKDIQDPARLKDLYIEANNTAREAAAQRLQGFNQVGNGTNSVTQDLIKQLEGFSTTAYRDGAGWSIGYGNQTHPDGTPVRQGDTINPAQGDRYLQAALQNHSSWKNLIKVPLTEPQQAALASFEYNLGSGIWQGQTASQIINAINGGNFNQAAQLMQQFNKSQGRTLPVLVQRRQLEGQLLTQYA